MTSLASRQGGSAHICVVAGAIANKAHNGGESWVRLSWILGLQRLGFEVHAIEQGGLDGIHYLQQVESRFGLTGLITLVTRDGEVVHGRSKGELAELIARAEFLVNISGNLSAPALLSGFRKRAYVDVDPGYTQFWHGAGNLGPTLFQHDAWFTVGTNIGTPACPIPTGGIYWQPVLPPVVLSEWPVHPAHDEDRMTTIASWRGAFAPVEVGGHRFGVKAHEWRRVFSLPSLAPQEFEIALAIEKADWRDRSALVAHGWHLVEPMMVAGDPDRFRAYVQASGGEFSAAQGIYVETNSGWFSDRTAAYLASGKPVLVQDTGVARTLPTGEGLLTFKDLVQAAEGAGRIAGAYTSHAQAARQLAETYFESDLVLRGFLDALGVDRPI